MSSEPVSPTKDSMADPWSAMLNDVEMRLSDVNRDIVLGDDEIDRLMGLVTDDDEKAGKAAIAEAAAMSGGLSPMMRVIAESFAERLSRGLRQGLAGLIDVTLVDVSLSRLSVLMSQLPVPSAMAVIGSRGVTGTGLIVADPFLASTFFDVMLGGGQAREMQIAMARPYSSLELKLFRQLSDYAAKAFSESLAELIKVEFNVDRLETNPTFVSLGKPTDNAIRLRVQVQFGKRGGLMDLVLPLSLFGAHQVVLKQEEDKETHDHSRWRDHLVQSAAAAELEIEALLAEFKMPLRAVLSLAVGQTLPLHIEPSQAIWIHGGGRRLAVGHIGRSHHHVAVRLAGPIQPISTKRLA